MTGSVPRTGIFLKKTAEFSKLFRHGSGTFRHTEEKDWVVVIF